MVFWMIYPQKLNSKKNNRLRNIFVICSIIFSLVLLVINKITTPLIPWAAITNAIMIYIWITVIYSIKRNTNIGGHVLLQMIAISLIILYIDMRFGFHGWSISIGIPIVLMVVNIMMLIMSMINYRHYIKYAIYHLIIVIISIVQVIVILQFDIDMQVLNIISMGISILSFIIGLFLNYKDFYKVLECKFHI